MSLHDLIGWLAQRIPKTLVGTISCLLVLIISGMIYYHSALQSPRFENFSEVLREYPSPRSALDIPHIPYSGYFYYGLVALFGFERPAAEIANVIRYVSPWLILMILGRKEIEDLLYEFFSNINHRTKSQIRQPRKTAWSSPRWRCC